MASFNKVILMGNLTRDPELRTTPAGQHVCKFGLAVNRVYNTRDGEKREDTTFVDIEAWGKQAETIAKYMTKGKSLMVEGRLKFESWEDKNSGAKRSRLSVFAENFQFLGGRDEMGSGQSGSNSNEYDQSAPPMRSSSVEPSQAEDEDMFEDDVPF
jgi:single-strand DNA-binding protein